MSAPHSQFSACLRLHCVLLSLLAPNRGPRLYCVSLATCLLCFFECSTECSRNNTHSSPQPSTVMLCQPVLGSFRPFTPGLVTPGTPLCTPHSAPLTPPALLLKTSTTRICIYRRKHWLHAGSQYFCTKCFPFAQHMYGHRVFPNTFIIYT